MKVLSLENDVWNSGNVQCLHLITPHEEMWLQANVGITLNYGKPSRIVSTGEFKYARNPDLRTALVTKQTMIHCWFWCRQSCTKYYWLLISPNTEKSTKVYVAAFSTRERSISPPATTSASFISLFEVSPSSGCSALDVVPFERVGFLAVLPKINLFRMMAL